MEFVTNDIVTLIHKKRFRVDIDCGWSKWKPIEDLPTNWKEYFRIQIADFYYDKNGNYVAWNTGHVYCWGK